MPIVPTFTIDAPTFTTMSAILAFIIVCVFGSKFVPVLAMCDWRFRGFPITGAPLSHSFSARILQTYMTAPISTIRTIADVVWRKWMAIFTMSASGKLRHGANTTKEVDLHGHSFQVFRIDTVTDTAQVINSQPLWNRPFDHLIRYPMSHTNLFANLYNAIPCIVRPTRPEPTGRGFGHLRPESIVKGSWAEAFRGCH